MSLISNLHLFIYHFKIVSYCNLKLKFCKQNILYSKNVCPHYPSITLIRILILKNLFVGNRVDLPNSPQQFSACYSNACGIFLLQRHNLRTVGFSIARANAGCGFAIPLFLICKKRTGAFYRKCTKQSLPALGKLMTLCVQRLATCNVVSVKAGGRQSH